MIITRIGDRVEFRLGEDRAIHVDVSGLTRAALAAERRPDGTIGLMLVLDETAASARRIEAGPAQLVAMHERIVEVMAQSKGPAATPPVSPSVSAESFPY